MPFGPEWRVVEETRKITDVPSDLEKQKLTSCSGEPHEFILSAVSYIDEMVCLVLSSLGQSAARPITQ